MPELVVEPLHERHLAAVAHLVRDPDVLRFTRIPVPVPPGFPREWLAMYEDGRRDGGRGVATQILDRLTRWALDELGAQRIYLIIDVENAASKRVAERCGYMREGVMRSIHLKAGQRIDAALWSRLASDAAPG
jgi:RimJ/RimL family protein N-acetyltransferase